MFRALLRLFPAEFRGDFGDDMAATFADQHRDVLACGGRRAARRLWWDTVRGVASTAPQEHWDLLQADVRYALRLLRRNPAFTAVAVLALTVGIGANAAVFAIVDHVLIRALPFRNSSELVTVSEQLPGALVGNLEFSAPDYEFIHRTTRSFSGMFTFRNQSLELSGIGESQRVVGARVSPEMFGVLSVIPALGRALTADDDLQNAKVVVLDSGLWTRAFGRDPTTVGKTLSLDGQPYTIVGVMGDGFEFPPRGNHMNLEPASVFLPIAFSQAERQGWGMMYNNTVIARLKPGVTLEQARGELVAQAPSLAQQYPPALLRNARAAFSTELSLPAVRFIDRVVGDTRPVLVVLMGAVAMVLLIACADVANLMLTRAGARQRELAVRSALGASAARVVRQLVTEALVLAFIAAAAGLMLAWVLLKVMLSLVGTALPRIGSVGLDRGVVIVVVVLAVVTPVIFGVVPALRAVLRSTVDALKEGSHGSTAGRERRRFSATLVVAQVALALMLSVGAGLLTRSFVRLSATSPGFRLEHAVTASVQLPSGRYPNPRAVKSFYRQIVDVLRGVPGVTAASAATYRPLAVRERRAFSADASAVQLPSLKRFIAASWVAGSYFEALGVPLKQGRFLTDDDGRIGARVGVISDMLARELWPDQNPIGRRIKWGLDLPENQQPWMTVVGVVGDVNQGRLGSEVVPQIYEPLDQDTAGHRQVNMIVRAAGDPSSVLAGIRAAMQRLDPALPLVDAMTIADVVNESVKPQRFSMAVVGFFAFVALGLAAIGIYGVLANVVSSQTHEIGVRMALGADARMVMWSVLRRALAMMAVGVAFGIAGALALARFLTGLLYHVQPTDLATFAGSAVLLAGIALVASLLPAWRATQVDPLLALRAE
jgi:putative ABC transport system permease protein